MKVREIGICSHGSYIYILGGYRFVLSKQGESNKFWRFSSSDENFEELPSFPYHDSFEEPGIYSRGSLHFVGKKSGYAYDLVVQN